MENLKVFLSSLFKITNSPFPKVEENKGDEEKPVIPESKDNNVVIDVVVNDSSELGYESLSGIISKKIPEEFKNNDTEKSKAQIHTVKSGESLAKIAEKYDGITLQEIIKANPNIDANKLKIGQKINIPEPQKIYSDMKVDSAKTEEYKATIVKMMKKKGVSDPAQLKELPEMIVRKAKELKIDPILVAGIIDQECDYRYKSNKIYGVNGKGMMQVTSIYIQDLYAYSSQRWFRGGKEKLDEIKKKYPTPQKLWEAVCSKREPELNMELGIIIYKGKLELENYRHPELSDNAKIKNALVNYNGHPQYKKAYGEKIIANYNNNKLS